MKLLSWYIDGRHRVYPHKESSGLISYIVYRQAVPPTVVDLTVSKDEFLRYYENIHSSGITYYQDCIKAVFR